MTSDMFSSATEQEGEHIGVPDPDSGNEGSLRPLASGDIQDFTYSGTATGAGTTTTIVDSSLCIFGDDFFIGATITFTDSGNSPVGNTSGSKTITDFAQATGTLTWSGALNATVVGDTFTFDTTFNFDEYVGSVAAPDGFFPGKYGRSSVGKYPPEHYVVGVVE